ncbi:MAG: Formate hydrogenlyase transcriptional activator [Nitrospirae bacterium]|nr:MAG: formate hydrogenlyase transcriptional activator [Nitrospira sp. OLB3]MBV6468228.1 Formate hydrogenlyase transcriptional activator [Nitrospirota bacterium]MCE7966855.1 GAF domain-containing protein [Nitrospira sp. NTP2]RIK61227.1 MAG: Fis family transcriptional regulator [Nitrospira sp.]
MTHPPPTQTDQLNLERYRALLRVAEAIASHSDLAALTQDLARLLPSVVPVNFVGLSLHDLQRGVMRLHVLQANVPADIIGGQERPPDETPAGLVWATQEPLLLNDLTKEQRWPEVIGLMREDGVQSCCLVPLTSAVRRLGALEFSSLEKDVYRTSDLELMQQVGRQVAVAVENVLNREAAAASQRDVERQRDRFGLLLRMTNTMASTLDLREVFKAVSLCLREMVSQEYASLVLCDGDTQRVRLHALDFPDNQGALAEGVVTDVSDSPAGLALQRKRPVVVNERQELETFAHAVLRLLVEKGFGSICSLPLLSRDRVIGCLNLASRQEHAFSAQDVEFLSQVAGQVALAVENALAYQEIRALKDRLTEEKLYLEEEIRLEHGFDDIIGESRVLKQVLGQVEIVAPTDATVLIQGETGTGKELIARAIHRLSGRRQRTFVKLNCAAIPTGLLESELFGHERGAFTGAISQKIGRFELAHEGTIFLDEVGEIPLELQSKLLRVLQEQEFERLGSTRTIRVDIRLVAATNRDLAKLVEEGRFRSDLYYRLNVFPVTMPPLRDRREDIPMLVRYFTQHYAARMKKPIESIPAPTLEALSRYAWPGNIRELENLIERAVILTQGTQLQVPLQELKLEARLVAAPSTTLQDAEREQILRVLREAQWVIGGPDGAAARLGLKRTTLTSKIKKLGLSRPRE